MNKNLEQLIIQQPSVLQKIMHRERRTQTLPEHQPDKITVPIVGNQDTETHTVPVLYDKSTCNNINKFPNKLNHQKKMM